MEKFINSSEYWYAPVGMFAFFILVAGLIGAWNGWKTALYFLGWNVVALIPSVLLLDKIVGMVNDNFDPASLNDSLAGINLEDLIIKYGGLLILVAILVSANIFAFIFYWFFRKKLKRTIKENKATGVSNAGARWVGAGVGIITALPMGVFMTESVSLASEDNGFTKFNGALTKALTGNKVDAYDADDKKSIIALMDTSALESLGKAFSGTNSDLSDGGKLTPEQVKERKNKVEDILRSSAILNAVTPEFIKKQAGGTINLGSISSDLTTKFDLPAANVARVKEILKGLGAGTNLDAIMGYIFVIKK